LLLAFPIIAIAALVKSVGLGEHLRRVEARLAALERGMTAATPPSPAPPKHQPVPPASEPTTSVPEPERRKPWRRPSASRPSPCPSRRAHRAKDEPRRAPRNAVGGLGRRRCCSTRRHLSRALLDRAGTARPRCAGHAWRTAGSRARRGRRMDT